MISIRNSSMLVQHYEDYKETPEMNSFKTFTAKKLKKFSINSEEAISLKLMLMKTIRITISNRAKKP